MIAISGLTKRYGDVLAVDDASLEVPVGSVCGLLGRNGAGKTTTFKCLLGFARPDAGEVRFDGAPLAPESFVKLGYVPERPELYRWLTVAQHLEFARRTQPAYDDARAKELVTTFRLNERKKAGKLSKGQQTALALILALVHRPKILILDEPASGLDPVMQRVVLDILVDAATSGATILISSHQIGQIDRAADRVAIMRDGQDRRRRRDRRPARSVARRRSDVRRRRPRPDRARSRDAHRARRNQRAGACERPCGRCRGAHGRARRRGRARRGPIARRPLLGRRRRRREPLMEYVEILRAKRILTWYTGILIVGLIIEAISFYASHSHNHNERYVGLQHAGCRRGYRGDDHRYVRRSGPQRRGREHHRAHLDASRAAGCDRRAIRRRRHRRDPRSDTSS